MHAIRDCGWVSVLWAVSPLRMQPLKQGENCSIVDWFEKIRACPQHEVHAIFATIAWVCWYARNLLIFQNKVLSHVECLGIATRAQWIRPTCSLIQKPSSTRLECNEEGVCKVATNAAFNVGRGVGVGAVLKQGDGSLLGCRFGFSAGAFTVIEGEAIALLEGLKLCREKGVMDVIAETDCQQLYWKLARHENDLSYLGDTLREIFELTSSFRRVTFSWTPREGNSIADKLALFALSSLINVSSFEVLPSVLNFVSLV
ncbi:uncharacterized protein LOC131004659 [Salvia miltiorrhiza]|uniref:uncharacterized protein LOC131004659 n=1 Tax=Salvia miltiorrhiza TaxID=226208 RepID=UPI0025AC5DD7|nr:uncharacterized protein LOC131004659 [Salvia miltiorrhiza]